MRKLLCKIGLHSWTHYTRPQRQKICACGKVKEGFKVIKVNLDFSQERGTSEGFLHIGGNIRSTELGPTPLSTYKGLSDYDELSPTKQ